MRLIYETLVIHVPHPRGPTQKESEVFVGALESGSVSVGHVEHNMFKHFCALDGSIWSWSGLRSHKHEVVFCPNSVHKLFPGHGTSKSGLGLPSL